MISQLHLRRFATAIAVAALFSTVRADELDPSIDVAPEGSGGPPAGAAVLRPIERLFGATHPLFRYVYTHAESVLSGPAEPQSTSIHEASVALRWNLGDDVTFGYSPTWTIYSNPAFENNVSHAASARVRHGFVDWNVEASDRYSWTSIPLIETGQQTTESTNTVLIGAQRTLGSRTTLELSAGESTRSAQSFTGFADWSTNDWVHYEFSSHFSASVGFGFGYVDMEDGPDMSYRRLNGRIRWRLTEKIKLDARAGYESRKFIRSTTNDSRSPIYGLSLSYLPSELTSVSVQADRRLTPSYFPGEVDRIASWQVDVRQRLLGRFYASVAFVHRTATHHLGLAGAVDTREDNGRSWQGRLTATPRPNSSLSVFYQTKRNRSSDSGFGFDGDAFGAEFNFRY
jgi:hypothetical protein